MASQFGYPEDLFKRLSSADQIRSLIGQTEDLYLDCKILPPEDRHLMKILAKQISGFANAAGGVLLFGMDARSEGKDSPDVIQSAQPFEGTLAVKSRIEDLVGDLVEPGLPGVEVAIVPDCEEEGRGFVVVLIPPTDGYPIRSRQHRDFFLRISSGTYPMEYFQLVDMFGRRKRPILSIRMEEARQSPFTQVPTRTFVLLMMNTGRGIAHFPSLRFEPQRGVQLAFGGVDGNGALGLPQVPTLSGVAFGGGADHVIHPGAELAVAKIEQVSVIDEWQPLGASHEQRKYREARFPIYVTAADAPTREIECFLPEVTIS